MSHVLVITSSLRERSNSDRLAEELARGASDAGHLVETVSLKGRTIGFCKGCLACQKSMRCVIRDDAAELVEKVKEADTVVFATPVYYYGMSGQLKTLLDRLNPLYPSDYRFRHIYLLSVAAEEDSFVPEKTVACLKGWVDCFEKAELTDSLFCGGIGDAGEAGKHPDRLEEAYEFGRRLR
ncbi:MAG: flavodoxin family protein [Clostridia bacterium]|nr:flavodoxin family protein [Clostridia bacterium]